MKISLNWLKDYLDLSGSKTPFDAQSLAHKLTMAGLEVESITPIGGDFSGVVIGEVMAVRKHPQADKLSLCQVKISASESRSIVCGAANVRAGLKVAVATVGTNLPNGMNIKSAKIRGELSEGMICSAEELRLAQESQGIMELPVNLKVGTPLDQAIPGLSDMVLELGITPNRADCLGHIGIAREVAALYERTLKIPEEKAKKVKKNPGLAVHLEDAAGCPAYLGRIIQGVKTLPSPLWVQNRLRAIGLRPINQIVDATNYVLMEFGQPTHAFDRRFIDGQTIRVCTAGKKMPFRTLDGKERLLEAEDLLICDAQKPVALAGIMGGENSEIREDTREIILECAYFKPQRIRATSRRLGISTDSSYRFERGTDFNLLETVMVRLTSLIFSWTVEAGGSAPEICQLVAKKAKLPAAKKIGVEIEQLNARLGTIEGRKPAIVGSEVKKMLARLGIREIAEKRAGKGKVMNFSIPSFRVDLERSIDLTEEVARLYGYDRIPTTLPELALRPLRQQETLAGKRRMHQLLAQYGFHETIHYSFVPADDLHRLGLPNNDPLRLSALAIRNPLAEDQAMLRTLLLPSLLRTATYNQNRGQQEQRLYEINKVFSKGGEKIHVAGILAGHRHPEAWTHPTQDLDFYDVKGVVEDLCELFLKAHAVSFLPDHECPFLHPGKGAVWRPSHRLKSRPEPTAPGEVLGWVGEIHPEVRARFDLKGPVWGFEMDFNAILGLAGEGSEEKFRSLPLYPAIRRDLALVVDENLPGQNVYHLISSMNKDIIESIHLFDVYRGQQIPQGKKSLAYAIFYLSRERTLTHDEVDRYHADLVQRLNAELGAEIRT